MLTHKTPEQLIPEQPGNPRVSQCQSVVRISTKRNQWVVPHNCEYLKLLIEQEKLNATDLRFSTPSDCQGFIRQLFLLALEDEHKNVSPSPLASFARALAKYNLKQTIF